MNAPRRLKAPLIVFLAAAATLELTPPSGRAPSRAAPRPRTTLYASQSARPAAQAAPAHTIDVTVADENGAYVKGLKQERFTVLDGGQPREIVSFAEDDAPVTVGILLDASASMGGAGLNAATVGDALRPFFQHCNPSDEFFLTAFDRRPQMLLGMSDDPAAVLSALANLTAQPKGQTALYDALSLTLSQASRGKHQKRAVLLVSDGRDTASHRGLSELRRQVKESDVTIYTVTLVGRTSDAQPDYAARAVLDELAGRSGGKARFPDNLQDFHASMVAVAVELRLRYTLGFVPAPSAKKDGWHEVKVKVDELRGEKGRSIKTYARAREGFYDPPRH